MDISFEWLAGIDNSSREVLEKKIRDDFQRSEKFRPCHSGEILVSIVSSSPFGSAIEGNVECSCGHMYAIFKGLGNGKQISYQFYCNHGDNSS